MTIIDDYLTNVEAPKRKELERIRSVAKKIVPSAEETISYGMPTLKFQGKPFLGFDAHKNHSGFLLSNLLHHAQWQTIDDPKGISNGKTFSSNAIQGSNGTTVNGINDNGQLVGFYVDAKGNTDGFLANPLTSSTGSQHHGGSLVQSSNLLQWFMNHM
jgi:hypothetical protein